MFDFFDRLFGYIEIAFSYFLNMIEALFTAVTALSGSITFVLHLTGFMPSIIASAMLVFTAIYVAKFIVGR